MSEWLLRGISAAGEGEYDVLFQAADEARTFRFTANEVTVGPERLLTFKTDEFEAETIYSRPSARAVIQAVTAFHQATVEPVLFAPPGEPPAR
jgi:hypothetical protein